MKIFFLNDKQNIQYEVLVDDEDYDFISNCWMYILNDTRKGQKKRVHVAGIYGQALKFSIPLHRLIYIKHKLLKDKKLEVDHKDRNPLNNQKENLRLSTFSQNQANRQKSSGNYDSKYKGVYKQRNKWSSNITFNKKTYNLGKYESERLAGIAYNFIAKDLHGEFACLNDIKDISVEEIEFVKKKIESVRKNREYIMSLTYNGETLKMIEWAKRFNLPSNVLRNRLYNLGWSIEKALNFPIRTKEMYITYNGETKLISKFSQEYNISPKNLWNRINKLKWSIEKSLKTPINKKYD